MTGLLVPAANFLAQQLADFPEMKSDDIFIYPFYYVLLVIPLSLISSHLISHHLFSYDPSFESSASWNSTERS